MSDEIEQILKQDEQTRNNQQTSMETHASNLAQKDFQSGSETNLNMSNQIPTNAILDFGSLNKSTNIESEIPNDKEYKEMDTSDLNSKIDISNPIEINSDSHLTAQNVIPVENSVSKTENAPKIY